MKIGGMGMVEILIIVAVALLIFGPKQLPKLGRALGKTVSSFREGMGKKKDEGKTETAKAAEALPEGSQAPRRKKRVKSAAAAATAETAAAQEAPKTTEAQVAETAEAAPVEAAAEKTAATVA
jgi:sec-independent protein translocase protein TatA